jgi:hypothetical protein
MSYSVHKLNIENHFHIIGRQDGVTGDSIKANDDIVFCAACQSVFLKDSWEYMNSTHCEQSETLSFVPLPAPNLVARKKSKNTENENETVIFEIRNEFLAALNYFIKAISPVLMQIVSTLILIGIVVLIGVSLGNHTDKNEILEITLALICLVLFLFGIYVGYIVKDATSQYLEVFDIINHKSKLKILQTGIKIGKKFYSYNYIARINSYRTRENHKLVIEFKDRLKIIKDFPTRDYERTKPFYLVLAWAAQFAEINFYTDDGREQGLLKSIEKNYAGRIWVADNSITF